MLKRVSILLSLIISGAAVSVSGSDVLYRVSPQKNTVYLSVGGNVKYDRNLVKTTADTSDGVAIDGLFKVGFSPIEGFEFGLGYSLYGDFVDTLSETGGGDLDLYLFWKPAFNALVRPVLSVKSTIPAGSKNDGLIPRNAVLSSELKDFYRTKSVRVRSGIGAEFNLRSKEIPWTLSLESSIIFLGDSVVLGGDALIQWGATEKILPSLLLSSQMYPPYVNRSSVEDGVSFRLTPALLVKLKENLHFRTNCELGLGDGYINSGSNFYAVDPAFTWGVNVDLFFGKKESAENNSLTVPAITAPERLADEIQDTTFSGAINDSTENSNSDTIHYITFHSEKVSDIDSDGIFDSVDSCPEKPELYNGVEDADGCPDFEAGNVKREFETYILEGVEFSSGSTSLSYSSKQALLPLVSKLKNGSIDQIEIRGFSDYSGGYKTNIKISQKRADSVRAYLLKQGVEASRIKSVGYGPNNPVADNRTAKGRRLNRRIEYVIIQSL